jgi:hypothetical protein
MIPTADKNLRLSMRISRPWSSRILFSFRLTAGSRYNARATTNSLSPSRRAAAARRSAIYIYLVPL